MEVEKESVRDFIESERLIVLVDLPGTTKSFQSRSDLHIAALLQEFYEECNAVFTERGGTVVKFMGDACLATSKRSGALCGSGPRTTRPRSFACKKV